MHSHPKFKVDTSFSFVQALLPLKLVSAFLVMGCMLAACGGGSTNTGGNSLQNGNGGGSSSSSATTYTAGIFNASSTYANRCASPRSGTDPYTNTAYPDMAGSAALENFWLRSWTHELYLWYSEVPD